MIKFKLFNTEEMPLNVRAAFCELAMVDTMIVPWRIGGCAEQARKVKINTQDVVRSEIIDNWLLLSCGCIQGERVLLKFTDPVRHNDPFFREPQ